MKRRALDREISRVALRLEHGYGEAVHHVCDLRTQLLHGLRRPAVRWAGAALLLVLAWWQLRRRTRLG